MDLYREQLLDHYHHPRGWGLRPSADREHRGYNPHCGDAITVQLMMNNDTITAMQYEAQGCVISIAAASLLQEFTIGKSRDTLQAFSRANIEELLGVVLPPARISCGVLALETVQAALKKL